MMSTGLGSSRNVGELGVGVVVGDEPEQRPRISAGGFPVLLVARQVGDHPLDEALVGGGAEASDLAALAELIRETLDGFDDRTGVGVGELRDELLERRRSVPLPPTSPFTSCYIVRPTNSGRSGVSELLGLKRFLGLEMRITYPHWDRFLSM